VGTGPFVDTFGLCFTVSGSDASKYKDFIQFKMSVWIFYTVWWENLYVHRLQH